MWRNVNEGTMLFLEPIVNLFFLCAVVVRWTTKGKKTSGAQTHSGLGGNVLSSKKENCNLGVYILVRKRYLSPSLLKMVFFYPSCDTSFFNPRHGFFSLILP
jgi:hypothetical protein